jgi:hypothetical protein
MDFSYSFKKMVEIGIFLNGIGFGFWWKNNVRNLDGNWDSFNDIRVGVFGAVGILLVS